MVDMEWTEASLVSTRPDSEEEGKIKPLIPEDDVLKDILINQGEDG